MPRPETKQKCDAFGSRNAAIMEHPPRLATAGLIACCLFLLLRPAYTSEYRPLFLFFFSSLIAKSTAWAVFEKKKKNPGSEL